MEIDFGVTVEFGIVDDVDPEKSYLLQDEPYVDNAIAWARAEYRCISIPYDIFNELYSYIAEVPAFFGSLKKPVTGLDPYGVTLVPPESCQVMVDILDRNIDAFSHIESIETLIAHLDYAAAQDKYVIFYGI